MPEIILPGGASAIASATRQQTAMAALGYYAETYPRTTTQKAVMITGNLYCTAIGLLAGDVVTNIITGVGTLGSGFSGIGLKIGLYSKAGLLLASSADVSGSYGSVGMKVNAMAVAYTVPTSDAYYCAALTVSTTPPNLLCCATSATTANGLVAGATIGASPALNAQTDFPASMTPTFGANSPVAYWYGVS